MSIFGSILGAVAGGLLSSHSAKKQQQSSQEFSAEQLEREAELQRDNWQYMQTNAHQYEIQDLKKAGLNPIISANSSHLAGMSSVSTPSAGIPNDNTGSIVSNALTAALDREVKKEMQAKDLEIEQLRADIEKTRAETEKFRAEQEAQKWKVEGNYYSAKTINETKESEALVKKLAQDVSNSIRLTDAQVNKFNSGASLDYATIGKVKADINLSLKNASLSESQKNLIDQGIDSAIAEYNKLSYSEKLAVLKSNGGSFTNWLGNNLRNLFGGVVHFGFGSYK